MNAKPIRAPGCYLDWPIPDGTRAGYTALYLAEMDARRRARAGARYGARWPGDDELDAVGMLTVMDSPMADDDGQRNTRKG